MRQIKQRKEQILLMKIRETRLMTKPWHLFGGFFWLAANNAWIASHSSVFFSITFILPPRTHAHKVFFIFGHRYCDRLLLSKNEHRICKCIRMDVGQRVYVLDVCVLYLPERRNGSMIGFFPFFIHFMVINFRVESSRVDLVKTCLQLPLWKSIFFLFSVHSSRFLMHTWDTWQEKLPKHYKRLLELVFALSNDESKT